MTGMRDCIARVINQPNAYETADDIMRSLLIDGYVVLPVQTLDILITAAELAATYDAYRMQPAVDKLRELRAMITAYRAGEL